MFILRFFMILAAEYSQGTKIVTDWIGPMSQGDESLNVFDLCETVRRAVVGLSGECFGALRLVGSDTNHNHEDIVESIEHFAYTGEWKL